MGFSLRCFVWSFIVESSLQKHLRNVYVSFLIRKTNKKEMNNYHGLDEVHDRELEVELF
jgi:hypothetical protein